MKQTFNKGVCPRCRRIRYIFKCKLFDSIPALKCGKCGYVWKAEK